MRGVWGMQQSGLLERKLPQIQIKEQHRPTNVTHPEVGWHPGTASTQQGNMTQEYPVTP